MFSSSPFPNECSDLGKGENSLKYKLSLLFKKIAVRLFPTSQFLFPSMKGGLRAAQLYVIMKKIYETSSEKFSIVEVRIARGLSSVFIAEAFNSSGKIFSYFAVDTFSGFDKNSIFRE